jgi:alanyl-tRNA synthetase
VEITEELFSEKGQKIDKEQFEKEFEKHRKLSRSASAGMFKGGLADRSEDVTKLHTTTHLLHTSLRKVLGDHVQQKGSNITSERLRFDFTHSKKLSEDEISEVEEMMNEQVKKDLPVTFETKTFKEAKDEGALAFFGERYGEKVKVYTIGKGLGSGWFSKEVCGGPHVKSTSEIGRVKIKKQEKIGAGLVRIYAFVEEKK